MKDGRFKHGLATKEYENKNKVKRWPAYYSWTNMRQRCNNPNNPDYRYYGGRGIKHCERWNSFNNFLDDMGHPPTGYTLDRIDNDKDYGPENCRWASRKEQSNNRGYNRQLTRHGKTQSVGRWAAELPFTISTKALYARIFTYNWTIERAFTQPPKKY